MFLRYALVTVPQIFVFGICFVYLFVLILELLLGPFDSEEKNMRLVERGGRDR